MTCGPGGTGLPGLGKMNRNKGLPTTSTTSWFSSSTSVTRGAEALVNGRVPARCGWSDAMLTSVE